eukprot:1139955-Pelagomonas_calceolata.AAC.2
MALARAHTHTHLQQTPWLRVGRGALAKPPVCMNLAVVQVAGVFGGKRRSAPESLGCEHAGCVKEREGDEESKGGGGVGEGDGGMGGEGGGGQHGGAAPGP